MKKFKLKGCDLQASIKRIPNHATAYRLSAETDLLKVLINFRDPLNSPKCVTGKQTDKLISKLLKKIRESL